MAMLRRDIGYKAAKGGQGEGRGNPYTVSGSQVPPLDHLCLLRPGYPESAQRT